MLTLTALLYLCRQPWTPLLQKGICVLTRANPAIHAWMQQRPATSTTPARNSVLHSWPPAALLLPFSKRRNPATESAVTGVCGSSLTACKQNSAIRCSSVPVGIKRVPNVAGKPSCLHVLLRRKQNQTALS